MCMGTITADTAARLSPQNTSEISEKAGSGCSWRTWSGSAQLPRRKIPRNHAILLAHSMGSFAAQEYVLDHSYSIDGLALSGSGALDGLVRLAKSAPTGEDNILNAAFAPARTPFDWLSRDPAIFDAFMNDPLCFGALQPTAYARICPSTCFQAAKIPSASDWKECVSLSIAITKRAVAISATISTRGDDTKCSMRSTVVKSRRIYFSGSLPFSTGESSPCLLRPGKLSNSRIDRPAGRWFWYECYRPVSFEAWLLRRFRYRVRTPNMFAGTGASVSPCGGSTGRLRETELGRHARPRGHGLCAG